MLFASSNSFQAGQIVGIVILVLVIAGLIRTFARRDLSWKQKVLGGGPRDTHRISGSNDDR
jgi:hypothetical protein